MGMYRRSGACLRIKMQASWWTSVGVAGTLFTGILLLSVYEAFQDYFRPDSYYGRGDESRRLGNSLIKEDPLIDSPIRDAKNKYWVIVHITIIAYMLLGLNTVCDAYFTGALDQMVNQWKVKPDVAGATFMAAGGSAPELFTSLIGTIVSESDVGFGTIVGSAVFNVLFVIGLCGFAAKEAINLTWWPLFRDCTYYIFGLMILAVFAKTGKEGNDYGEIELWEAIIMFVTYIGYCVVMYFNPTLEAMVAKPKIAVVDQVTRLDKVAPVPDTGSTGDQPDSNEQPHHIRVAQPKFNRSQSQHDPKRDSKTNGDPESEGSDKKAPMDEIEEEDDEEDDIEALLMRPDSTFAQIVWYLSLPIYVPLYYFIPKPTDRCFLLTFCISLVFIAGFSLFLVYCVEILGEVLGIHVIVMGFTLLAAGTSIPDAVSSVAVARAGEGDMAVSSSIGSNIFDILVGLPVPWIIKIGFVEGLGKGINGATVRILSDFIVLYVIILMVMVVCVVLSIHFLGWVLNRQLGIGMTVLYALFLLIVLLVEFNSPDALKF